MNNFSNGKQRRWQPFVSRYRRGEWRTPIFRDLVLDEAKQYAGTATCLDIGCGRGFDLEPDFQSQISEHCHRYIGIEPDDNATVCDCFSEVHRCGFEEASLAPESIDLAYSVMVLEHVSNPARFWGKLWEVLRPGGTFWGFTVDARHYFAFTSYWMERLRMKDIYLRLLHSSLGHEEFEHYGTYYRANTPRQISRLTQSFRARDYINFLRVGQLDSYLPGLLRPCARLVDRGLLVVGGPGSMLAVRLEK